MVIQALAVNSTLRTLDLGWNNLCDDKVTLSLQSGLISENFLTPEAFVRVILFFVAHDRKI